MPVTLLCRKDTFAERIQQFVYGSGIDEILRIDKYDGAVSTPYYVHTNAIGSVTAVTDDSGSLVERVSYDVFGMPTFTDAADQPLTSSSIGNDILFQGRRYDKETNLYYYRARYYDPIMGRFLQTDPMGYADSMNLYQGFNMNPMNFVDPMGTESQRSKFVRETVDKYNKLVKWGAITRSEANKQLALDIKAWEDEHSGPAEQVETESTILKDFFVGCLNTIKKINNYLPGKAKKAAHEAIDERNARLQAKNEELLEEETWNIQTEIDGKKTSPEGRKALGDMAYDATDEAQWAVALGVYNKLKNVSKWGVEIKIERKLYGSKKHGIHWKEGPARAKKMGIPQGKFGSEADLDFVLSKAIEIGPGKEAIFDLPVGHSCVVYMPDGTLATPSKVWLRVNNSGTIHAYPLID